MSKDKGFVLNMLRKTQLMLIVSLRNRTAGRRGRQIACVWRTWQGYNLRVLSWSWLTSMFSGLLQKDLFKRKWSLAKSYFKQNYCHVCHTRFAVFFSPPSYCACSLLIHSLSVMFWGWKWTELYQPQIFRQANFVIIFRYSE